MRRSTLGILVAVVALPGVAAAAFATPPSGVTVTPVAKGAFARDPDVSNLGVTFRGGAGDEVTVQSLTLAPGGTSGWHRHQGVVLVTVKAGELTIYDSSCRKTTYPAGTAFSESSAVHVGRNEGTTPAEVVVTFAAPANRALTLDRPNPGCSVD
jgi:quercetin dioxygenase-like cupin family protein